MSTIQFTELLIDYCHDKVFPSEYINDFVVLPLPNTAIAGSLIPESKIYVLDIKDTDTEVHSGQSHLLPQYRRQTQCQFHTIHSGKIFKNKPKYSN